MKFSTQFSRRVRSGGELEREEQTDVEVAFVQNEVEIKVEQEVRNVGNKTREATTIHAKNVDIRDIKEVRDNLSEWCLETGKESRHIDTGFIDGECINDGASVECERLRIKIEQDGIQFQSVDEDLTIGKAVIPAAHQSDDGEEPAFPVHHHEFELLLRTALHCVENELNSSGPRLDVAGEFSGPLDESLRSGSLPLYLDNNGAKATSMAGQALDRELRSIAEADPNKSTTNLIGELFDGDPPVLRASEVDNENKGVQFLLQGALMGLRNPLTHRDPSHEPDQYLGSFSRRYARDILYFHDLLFLLLENEVELLEE